MIAVVVDTSSFISYFAGKGDPTRVEEALEVSRVYLSPVVAAELLSARMKPAEHEELLAFLKDLPACETDFDHWVRVGMLRSEASKRGLVLSTPDAHVAQCALDLHAALLTEDKIFTKLATWTRLRVG